MPKANIIKLLGGFSNPEKSAATTHIGSCNVSLSRCQPMLRLQSRLRLRLLILLLLYVIVSGLDFPTSSGLKLSLSAPELVKLNDAFWLNCSHDKATNFGGSNLDSPLEFQANSKEIYAIKWFKDNEEFYRYLPNATPKVTTYDTNGVQLDVSRNFFFFSFFLHKTIRLLDAHETSITFK